MMDELISVIIPVYNVEKYLDDCIQSIVDQTYSNLEIILVNDGSSDQSPLLCDKWANKDMRIRVIHKENGGASSARNAGINVANGEYIGFVDSDDFIAKDMYEILLTAILKSGKGIADCGINYFLSDERIIENKKRVFSELDVRGALDSVFSMRIDTSVCCKLFNRSVFSAQRFPDGESNEEFPLIIPSIITSKGIVQIAEYKYFYRKRAGSVTNAAIPNTKVLIKNLRLMEKQLRENGLQTKAFNYFSAQYSFFHCLKLEKKYEVLTEDLRSDYQLYRSIMWKNLGAYLLSSNSSIKDKILYILILTKLLRPLYKVFYHNHL